MTEPRPTVTPTAEIPDLPVGTLLRFAPGEWSHCATARLGTYLEMTLSRMHRNAVREDEAGLWVWLVGHEHPACTWAHVDPHPPCLQVMVRVDALTAAAGGWPPACSFPP
ncbi:hypothetical protein ACQEVC_07365 [Plantactinospora sp. CA-294935]|uniref:hypothetical protein n=1 Tax=Plantactinospora sp. CA-294935 TaxID=3240012 RepID=UPI003D8CFDAA